MATPPVEQTSTIQNPNTGATQISSEQQTNQNINLNSEQVNNFNVNNVQNVQQQAMSYEQAMQTQNNANGGVFNG